MPDSTPVRKSGRQRVPNRKFETEDTIGLADLNRLLSDSEGEQQSLRAQAESLPRDDFDFPAHLLPQEHDQGSSDSDLAAGNVSDGSPILTPVEGFEDARSYGSDDSEPRYQGARFRKRKFIEPDVRSRGLTDNQLRIPEDRMGVLAGPGEEDYRVLSQTHKHWSGNPVLPRREGMRVPFGHTEEARNMEGGVGWDWYYDQGGREFLRKRQGGRSLSAEEGERFVAMGKLEGKELLMGAYGRQKLFNLPHLQSLEVDTAHTSAEDEPDANQQSIRKRRRHGWMLNVGTRVRCLDWAPNHDEDTQYLALASVHTPNEISKESPKTSPAFTPALPTPSCVQVWAFAATNALESESSLDSAKPPELRLVLCTEWGDAKQLKWCPMPREIRDEDAKGKTSLGLLAGIWGDGYARVLDVQIDKDQAGTTTHVKFESAAFASRPEDTICTCLAWLSPTDLAIGHSNGYVAVYDLYPTLKPLDAIAPPDPRAETTDASQQANQSNAVKPPEPVDPPPNPQPTIRIPPPHSLPSPLLSLTPAYPTHPALLATSSLSGHIRLLSLTSPLSDYVLASRTRFPPSTLIYSPHIYSVLFADEPSDTVRANPLRYWGAGVGIGRTSFAGAAGFGWSKGSQSVKGLRGGGKLAGTGVGGLGRGCLDGGKVHSCVAWGGADGSVMVSNPVGKVLGGRRDRRPMWQMCVFRQEWARRRRPERAPPQAERAAVAGRLSGGDDGGVVTGGDVEMADRVEGGGGDGGDVRSPDSDREPLQEPFDEQRRVGISRITESYKAERIELGPKSDRPTSTTIFEEETGVTAVCWNPNLSCGGWLAVGWGSGLLRVEDLAI